MKVAGRLIVVMLGALMLTAATPAAAMTQGGSAAMTGAERLPQAVNGAASVGGETTQAGLTHYIVFEIAPHGVIRPLYHELVQLATSLVSLNSAEVAARLALPHRNNDRLAVWLETGEGRVVYRDVVTIPLWLRGEFHGDPVAGVGSQIDGHIFPLDRATFVVRVPAIQRTRLHLQGGLAGAGAEFDLAAPASDATLPLAAFAGELAVTPEVAVGDPGNRVDLLIMSDGYTASEEAQFDDAAANVADNFLGITPYAEYRNHVNVHTLFTATNQAGADHPPYDEGCSQGDPSYCADTKMLSDPLAGTFVDTAFDAAYCTQDIHRLLTVNTAAVLAAAAAVPDWDQILVIVNDATYGGAGGALAVISKHSLAVDIAQREYGHAFTDLADEYETPYPGHPACSDIDGPACEANVTDQTSAPLIKWAPWILPGTPLPTPEGDPLYADVVGLFEGARFLATGMYRSGDNCLMRTLGRPFCQVPSQAYVLKLYDGGWGVPASGIDLIEPGSENPPPGSVSASYPGSITFSVDLLEPVGGPPLSVEWHVEDVLDPTAQSSSYTFVPSGPGSFEIRLDVADTTPLAHPAMAGTSLQSSRVWELTAGAPVGGIAELPDVAGQQLDMDGSSAGVGSLARVAAAMAAGAIALGAAAWYARRRWLR